MKTTLANARELPGRCLIILAIAILLFPHPILALPEVDFGIRQTASMNEFARARSHLVVEDFCYSVTDYGLTILDVSDPTDPTKVSDIPFPDRILDLAESRNHLYLITSQRNFQIYGLDDPRQPELVGTVAIDSSISRIAMNDSIACLIDGNRFIDLYDVSDPQEPIRLSRIECRSPNEPCFKDESLITSTGKIYNISDPSQPRLVNDEINATSVAVFRDYLYARRTGGRIQYPLTTYFLGSPSRPVVVGGCYYEGDLLQTRGEYLIGYSGQGLAFLSLASRRNPSITYALDHVDNPFFIKDTLLFAGSFERLEGFGIYNISNFTRFEKLGDWQPAYQEISNIFSHNGFLYCLGERKAEGGDVPTLQIISVDDPANPAAISLIDVGEENESCRQIPYNDYIYQLFDRRIDVLSVADPENPHIVWGLFCEQDYATGKSHIFDDVLYCAGATGISRFSLENPERPERLSVICENSFGDDPSVIGNFEIAEPFIYAIGWAPPPLNQTIMSLFERVDEDSFRFLNSYDNLTDGSFSALKVFDEFLYLFERNSVVRVYRHELPVLARARPIHGEPGIDRFQGYSDDRFYFSAGENGFAICREVGLRFEITGYLDTPGVVQKVVEVDSENRIFAVLHDNHIGIYDCSEAMRANNDPLEIPVNISLSFYPNPVNAYLTIALTVPNLTDVGVKLFDLNGRQVFDGGSRLHAPGTSSLGYDLKGIPDGVYLCRVNLASGSLSQKVVIIK